MAETLLRTGIDLQPFDRLARLLADHDGNLTRIFTAGERTLCDRGGKMRNARYAAAFAAKEAVLKAIGTGWSADIEWSDVDTATAASSGVAALLGGAARAALRAHITRVWVSWTLTREEAIAFAVAEGEANA
jgi:holo-[acyl-carrier protein] synthase